MADHGGGVVINVTSGAAKLQPLDVGTTRLEGSDLGENGPLYGASKAALDRMANVIAFEGKAHNIAVINVSPGLVLTETMELTLTRHGANMGDRFRQPVVPAKAIVWLCACDDPMRFSGQVVDGPELHDQLGLSSSYQ
jgi:NAD(P)-dependent dehydrogenase (short-subunit alcohol dehydrogenase family)